MKIVTVVGARPQFIKAAVLSRFFQISDLVNEIVIHTGQHYDNRMSEVFFREMGIQLAKYNLEIGSGKHGEQTGLMLAGIEKVLIHELPDYVLVYGDTNSTLAGALAAAKLHIPIVHVEAGLRSFNMRMPEEINRILTDRISEALFISSQNARLILESEGIDSQKIFYSGDIMYDVILMFSEIAKKESQIINSLNLNDKDFILCTFHRAENTDNIDRLRNILNSLEIIAKQINVIFPVHPRTRAVLSEYNLIYPKNPNIRYIEPIGYFDMLSLEANSRMIMTDSGGVQKEAYFHGKQCITLREETEWVELVQFGWNNLVSPLLPPDEIAKRVISGLQTSNMSLNKNIYGQGNAGNIIGKFFEDRA